MVQTPETRDEMPLKPVGKPKVQEEKKLLRFPETALTFLVR